MEIRLKTMIVSQPTEQFLGPPTQLAGALFMAGLVVGIISLVWTSSMAMLAFVSVAVLLFGASVATCIWKVFSPRREETRVLANESLD
jgi:uncharacterized membrane protein YqjE